MGTGRYGLLALALTALLTSALPLAVPGGKVVPISSDPPRTYPVCVHQFDILHPHTHGCPYAVTLAPGSGVPPPPVHADHDHSPIK